MYIFSMHQIFFDSGMFNLLKDCGSSSSMAMLDLPVNCNMSLWMESNVKFLVVLFTVLFCTRF